MKRHDLLTQKIKTLAEIYRIALIVERDWKERSRLKKELKWAKAQLATVYNPREDVHDR